MDKDYYWIVDIGSTSLRVFAVYLDGRMQLLASYPLVTEFNGEYAEYDAHTLQTILQQTLQTFPSQGVALAAGIACQRSTVMIWNKQSGQPLHAALSWADRRAHAWMQTVSVDPHWVRSITGLRWSPYYGIGKLRWLLQHVPEAEILKQQQCLGLGPLVSFAVQQLTGQYSVDESIAARTLLWNVVQRGWEAPLCALAQIPMELLPPVKSTLADYGYLHARNIPLKLVIADQSAALHALDVPDDAVFINIGTGAFMFCRAPLATWNDAALLNSLISSDANQQSFAIEATVNGAGAALQWAAQHLGLSDAELKTCTSNFEKIKAPPVFINTVSGLGSPWWQAGDETRWLDAETISTDAKIAGVIESIIFLIAHNIERMAHHLRLREIYLSGGVSNIAGFAQCLANLTDMPVKLAQQSETTVYGAARLLANSINAASLAPLTLSAAFMPSTESNQRIALRSRYHVLLKHLPASEPVL